MVGLRNSRSSEGHESMRQRGVGHFPGQHISGLMKPSISKIHSADDTRLVDVESNNEMAMITVDARMSMLNRGCLPKKFLIYVRLSNTMYQDISPLSHHIFTPQK